MREENPFEDTEIAQQWIRSVEGEKGLMRDNEIYPQLRAWASGVHNGVIVEIGSGQGICSQHLGDFRGEYIGIEPSDVLTARGRELYGDNNRMRFIIGSAYELPINDGGADGAFSVNVWFHLENIARASLELGRILKSTGKFIIITANPDTYDIWKNIFEDSRVEGKLILGKLNVPIHPMSRVTFYMHSQEEITDALKNSGLEITSVTPLGKLSKHPERPIFISIEGYKI
jgi:SAM-dependent methyltransferase